MDSTHPNFKHKVPRRVSSRGGPPLLFGQNNNPPNQNFHGDNEGQGPAPANADPVWDRWVQQVNSQMQTIRQPRQLINLKHHSFICKLLSLFPNSVCGTSWI